MLGAEYLWSSKLASLAEVLQWFQNLPDLAADVTGMHDVGTSELGITIDNKLDAPTRARVQCSFNQGLRNLHTFSPFEALRHFSRCVQVCLCLCS